MKTHSSGREKNRNLRRHITQEAARLIANQECPDFQSARRKAAQRIGCRDQRQLPDNREIEEALREYQQLFQQDTQPHALRYLRQMAVEAMQSLRHFSPRLTGPVLDGTADSSTPVQLYLYSDSPDDITLHLIQLHIPYHQSEIRLRYSGGLVKPHPMFDFRAGNAVVELIGLSPADRANPPLNPLDERPDPGATLKQVRSLLV